MDLVFVPARGTGGIRSGRCPLDCRSRNAHDLLCDAVGFLLVYVVWRTDLELGLDDLLAIAARAAAAAGTGGLSSDIEVRTGWH